MNGILLLEKEQGMTSFKAVAILKRIYGERHVGHSGTLDPLATGVLPIMFGRATKLCDMLMASEKKYEAVIKAGITTDTLDIDGNILSECEVKLQKEKVLSVIESFVGEIEQIPPMYSALKKDGVPLYKLARKGEVIEREARKVTISSIELLDFSADEFKIAVTCSKGTYIRTLADDIGKALGTGCIIKELRRTYTSGFDIRDCHKLSDIEEAPEKYLMPADKAVMFLREAKVSEKQKIRFMNGGELSLERLKLENPIEGAMFRVYSGCYFCGIGIIKQNDLAVKCVIGD